MNPPTVAARPVLGIAKVTRHDLPALIEGKAFHGKQRFEVRYPYTGDRA